MNIKIIANVSKLSLASNGAIQEYSKRLSRYCKFNFYPCKKEKDAIKHLSSSATIFLVTPSKETLSSEELAKTIEYLGVSGQSDLLFLIGFSQQWIDETLRSNKQYQKIETLSISSLTFSASLASAVLSEQIYRAYRILNKEPYHK